MKKKKSLWEIVRTYSERFKYLAYKRTGTSEFRLQTLKAASLCIIYVASSSQMTEQRRCTLFANNPAGYYQIRYGRATVMWFKLLMAWANFDIQSIQLELFLNSQNGKEFYFQLNLVLRLTLIWLPLPRNLSSVIFFEARLKVREISSSQKRKLILNASQSSSARKYLTIFRYRIYTCSPELIKISIFLSRQFVTSSSQDFHAGTDFAADQTRPFDARWGFSRIVSRRVAFCYLPKVDSGN